MDNFADLMTSEGERIAEARNALNIQLNETLAQIDALDRELVAIEAYEQAKNGKAPVARKSTNGAGTRRAPRGSRREDIVATVTAYPQGLTRGELLELLGLKGNKSGEMSVSNALTALTKNDTLTRNDERKYVLSV